ncbi:MAG: Mrp/NBP35 family ATP-binding protein [Rickettsia endosymbiont of Bryobia graminum]|nr:Mrp/NBP35 family ATP-binding protein [Rickettsia endosymbiont of Bryobia graminum]
MDNISKQEILNNIADITFKDQTKLVDVISDIIIKDRDIGFAIDISGKNLQEVEEIRNKAINKLNKISNITKVTIVLTNSKNPDKKPTNIKPKHLINGVKKVVLVASGKGGVGKSTIAALIAEQLNLEGHKVGIVDADIYGPSIPHIFGVKGVPEIVNNKMIPLVSRDIKIISIGLLIRDYSAAIWRGPVASKTIYQLLSLTNWGELDYLIIDMPPGTGDMHLSILENYYLDGVIIVTTPQKITQIDVVRSIDLYKKLSLPILGIIENMSNLSSSASESNIENSKSNFATEHNIPLICKIPIEPKLSYNCDNGLILTGIIDMPIKNFI